VSQYYGTERPDKENPKRGTVWMQNLSTLQMCKIPKSVISLMEKVMHGQHLGHC